MLVAICGLKDGIRIADKKAAEYCAIKKCEWLRLVFRRGGKGANGQNGRPTVNYSGGSAGDALDFFNDEQNQRVRNFRGNKKSPRFSGR